MVVNFSSDVSIAADPFPHFWEEIVGSGHAALCLRSDWQKQLTMCHEELGFKYVRFHGLLSDDMCTLVDENDTFVYSFFNADQIFDFLLSIGMKPFVELSFMPLCLSSGPDIVFHYKGNVTPPRNYQEWETLIGKLVAHWLDRYGFEEMREWFFEVSGTSPISPHSGRELQQDYFLLATKHTATAIKNVNASLKVGGPATADNAWITEFSDYCTKNSVPFDFISTHHYPTDSFGMPGDDTLTQLADSTRSVLQTEVTQTRKQAGSTPVYYTEWNTSSNPFDTLHDQPYAASHIIKTIMEARGYVQGYSYWIFSDIFEENYFSSNPFHGGFGLVNIYGIPKPAYRAFEILHKLGTDILHVEGTHPTVDAWVIRKAGAYHILITNSQLPRHPISEEEVQISLFNTRVITKAYVERIDDEHSNSTGAWQKMGSPQTLRPSDVKLLEESSSLKPEPIHFTFANNNANIVVKIPPPGNSINNFGTMTLPKSY